MGKVRVAAVNISLVFANLNIFTPLLTAHLRAPFPVLPVMANIPVVLVLQALVRELMVARSITLPLAPLFVKRLIRIIVIIVPTITLLSMVV